MIHKLYLWRSANIFFLLNEISIKLNPVSNKTLCLHWLKKDSQYRKGGTEFGVSSEGWISKVLKEGLVCRRLCVICSYETEVVLISPDEMKYVRLFFHD